MNDSVRKLELKKLIQEYNFLLTDEEYKNEVINENKEGFLKEIHEKKIELGLIENEPYKIEAKEKLEEDYKKNEEIKEEQKEGEEEKKDEETKTSDEESDNEIKKKSKLKKVKKVYREIVKKTHPDKTNSDEYIELYNKATEFYNKNELIELYFIAVELNIDVEIEEEDISNISETIRNKRRELHNLEMSYLWLWYNAKTKEQKDKVVALFVNKS